MIGLSSAYEQTFGKLLDDVASRHSEETLTAFWPQVGAEYSPDHSILFVGQAVDEWGGQPEDDPWFASVNGKFRAPDVSRVREFSEYTTQKDDCPLSWLLSETRLSKPFWRTIGLIEADEESDLDTGLWTRRVAWSNLFKVSYQTGGNPSEELIDTQLRGCCDLLAREIQELRPRAVVVLGGKFVKLFCDGKVFDADSETVEKRLALGSPVVASANGVVTVLSPHPFGSQFLGIGCADLAQEIRQLLPS